MIGFLGMNAKERVHQYFYCSAAGGMATFSIQNKDCVLFDCTPAALCFEHVVTAGGDSEDSLTICNTCNYNVIHRKWRNL